MGIFNVDQIEEVLSGWGVYPLPLWLFFLLLFGIFLIGMYFFWWRARLTGKDRNSIFDLYFVSGFIALVWSRVSYILANISSFTDIPWSIFPYEKYVDGVYVFRLLPWRYLRIWDGGILFTGLFAGFSIAAFIYATRIKKWNWRQIMSSVVVSSNLMFGLTLYIYGAGIISNSDVLNHGVYVVEISLIYLILDNLVRVFVKLGGRLKERISDGLLLLYSFVASGYLYKLFSENRLSDWDVINTQVFGVSILVFIVIYVFLMLRKENISIESVSGAINPDIATNRSISISSLDKREKGE
jgi:hypothetical protein